MKKLLFATGYFFSEALTSLMRHKAIHTLGIVTSAISLFVLGFSFLITGNLKNVITEWKENLEVRLFLQDGITKEEINNLIEVIKKRKEVRDTNYTSKEDALNFLKKHAPDLISPAEEENPLPASINVKLKGEFNDSTIKGFISFSEKLPNVSETQFDWSWVTKLNTYTLVIGGIGWLLGIVLGIAALLTISNLIRILILSRHDEIEIMSLVGATNTYIKGPFVVEGFFEGTLGGITALILLWGFFFIIRGFAKNALFIKMAMENFLDPWHSLTLIIIGGLIGSIGAFISFKWK